MFKLRSLLAAGLFAMAAMFPAPQAKALDYNIDGFLVLNCGAATATAGAATLAAKCGKITTEALSTAAGAVYTLTITNTVTAAADSCYASAAYGTSTTGTPAVSRVQEASGSLVITLQNIHASAALNGTLVIKFLCNK